MTPKIIEFESANNAEEMYRQVRCKALSLRYQTAFLDIDAATHFGVDAPSR
jgi:hypothetical protein